ncbi:MAG: DUF1330 domain-containing protein [Bacteroidota bacterium]|nr:DUF1330 domain-containing protein [Bacteroidota bacterium]
MPAYVIVEVSIHNPEEYETYKKLTPASIAEFDGRFVVRGGQTITLEGDWKPERIVVLEFPSVDQANTWWNSQAYSGAKKIRQRAASTRMIIVDGISH